MGEAVDSGVYGLVGGNRHFNVSDHLSERGGSGCVDSETVGNVNVLHIST